MRENCDESDDNNITTSFVEKPSPPPVNAASVTNVIKTKKNNARGSKRRKNRPNQEEKQENEFLKVKTQHLQKQETKADLLANLIKKKVENCKGAKRLKIMYETELRQVLFKCVMQPCQNDSGLLDAIHPEIVAPQQSKSVFTKNLEHGYYTTQPAITCSKLTIETLEQGVKYVQS